MLFIPYGAPYLFPLVPHIFIFILLTSVELDQITMTSLIASSANTVFFVEAPSLFIIIGFTYHNLLRIVFTSLLTMT